MSHVSGPVQNLTHLCRDLSKKIAGEVRFDPATRAAYSHDASNYRQPPLGVVLPKNRADIITTVALCAKYEIPLLSRGAGTSIAGQSVNEAVILDYSKYYNRILSFDSQNKRVTVEPGIVLDSLNKELKKNNLLFGPDPATHSRCTIGGMIGNNSCGTHSLTYGKVVENIESLEILTYDGTILTVGPTTLDALEQKIHLATREGEIYKKLLHLRDHHQDFIRNRFPILTRRVSGYNLDQLLPENDFNVAKALVGTEGTCMVILNATLKVHPLLQHKQLLLIGCADVLEAARITQQILAFKPYALEGLDYPFIHNMKIKNMHSAAISGFPEGRAWLIAEFASSNASELDSQVAACASQLKTKSWKRVKDHADMESVWAVRESAFGATVFVPNQPDVFSGWEDAAVPPEQLETYLIRFQHLLDKYQYTTVLYGHFGEGCLHTRISFDLKSTNGIAHYRKFIDEVADLVISLGGSLSGEHGDGQARAELLPKMFGQVIVDAFRTFKEIWDPQHKMNPGKIVLPYAMDANLKFGSAAFTPENLQFRYPSDKGDIFKSTERCIGIGKCRRSEDAAMCPSYIATKEEIHSTRGRAHILHEMLRGEVLTNGWNDKFIKESFDLCLSCKSCKTECPTNVDIATYKSEFLYHYYQFNKRPRSEKILASMGNFLPLASNFSRMANFFTQTPWLRSITKSFLGITPERQLPKLANKTFRRLFRSSQNTNPEKTVVLWVDTFSNYFSPNRLVAAAEVLESLGYTVKLPNPGLCCGRPLYDAGMIPEAKQNLNAILEVLRDDLAKKIPVICIEPGCLSVFKDELINLLPDQPEAHELSAASFSLLEWLDQADLTHKVFDNTQKALTVTHCHEKALQKTPCSSELLRKLSISSDIINTGCCGMAGSFGYSRSKYDVSMKIAKQNLHSLLSLSSDTQVIADGFSCGEQIRHLTGVTPIHSAEWIRKRMKHA